MEETFIQFELLSEDDDGSVQIGITSSNSIYSSNEDCYLWPMELQNFGRELKSFPKSRDQEVIFQNGVESKDHYSFILLRAFVYSSNGRSALEVKMNSNKTNELKRIANYCIQCEIASLNRLGQELVNWDIVKEKVFKFEFPRAG